MKLETAKRLLKESGYKILNERTVTEESIEKDYFDIEDYVLHHAKYEGILENQFVISWIENYLYEWLSDRFSSIEEIDFEDICEDAVIAANLYVQKNLNKGTQEVSYMENDNENI